MVEDYFNWQSPTLLLSAHLAGSTRAMLEKAACSRAMVLAAYYRLFPKVIDCDVVNAALVESMLRANSGQQEASEEKVTSVHYVEI